MLCHQILQSKSHARKERWIFCGLMCTLRMSTTLHKILQQHQLGAMFNEIVAIVQESVDTSSLLEQLSELIEPLVSADEAEQVIRTILQVLERGQESLFAQEPIQLYQKKLQSKNEDEELVDDEALDGNSPEVLLHQVFVDLSLEQIQETLKSQNYNVERAIDFLLQKDIEQAKPVCRHFIMGNCFRSDCWFSHDPKQMVCKFWIKGRCTKGNQCEFLHSVQQSPKERRPESPKKPEDTKSLGRDDFPALGSPKKQTIDLTSPSQPWSKAASQPKVESRQEKQYAQYQSQQRKVKLDSKWMSTGAAVNNTYFEFRQDALKAASERNRLYQQYFN
ncbi:hypothetical protein EDD86DRAFT_201699 [Gorgonomyces haynaldii]|nr:hypothetical protein EDD86DRAFT_201699 [Gorgonomyces haynaldii]